MKVINYIEEILIVKIKELSRSDLKLFVRILDIASFSINVSLVDFLLLRIFYIAFN